MSDLFDNITVKDVKSGLGDLARVMRKRERLTQDQLAQKLGLSRMTVQNLEAGRNSTIETVLLVMQHFNLLKEFHNLLQAQITNNSYDSLY